MERKNRWKYHLISSPEKFQDEFWNHLPKYQLRCFVLKGIQRRNKRTSRETFTQADETIRFPICCLVKKRKKKKKRKKRSKLELSKGFDIFRFTSMAQPISNRRQNWKFNLVFKLKSFHMIKWIWKLHPSENCAVIMYPDHIVISDTQCYTQITHIIFLSQRSIHS